MNTEKITTDFIQSSTIKEITSLQWLITKCSLVIGVCCETEIFVTGWSLVQRGTTECGVSECDCEASKMEEVLAH
jgi:hypothetical protein